MTAMETMLAGLFDYAGLYPPASLSLRSAANNYVEYTRGKHAAALGRFIVNADRLEELRIALGASVQQFRISAITAGEQDLSVITEQIRGGMRIEAIETKCGSSDQIEAMAVNLPVGVEAYFEVPVGVGADAALDMIFRLKQRIKIRMGGVVSDAFPSTPDVVNMLVAIAKSRARFKATAGLHHPIRSSRPLTYKPDSQTGTMHGFLNLCCAAAVVYFGGQRSVAEKVLGEEDPSAWRIRSELLEWRHLKWTREQISILRREFFLSIGSCSFDEPIRDLESLGWL